MNGRHFLLRYLILLGAILSVAFLIHRGVREKMGLPGSGDLLPYTYLLNLILAFAIVAGLFFVRHKMKHQLGFLFIGGSLLKFLLFFLFIYPEYSADGTLDRAEFSGFFVPYFLSLFLETYFTSLMLKNLEEENPG